MTFREQIEEILDNFAREYKGLSPSSCAWEQYQAMKDRANTRICEAVARLAEGMPDLGRKYVQPNATSEYIALVEGMAQQYKECQAFIRKECGV